MLCNVYSIFFTFHPDSVAQLWFFATSNFANGYEIVQLVKNWILQLR